jgi:hypothetical protein
MGVDMKQHGRKSAAALAIYPPETPPQPVLIAEPEMPADLGEAGSAFWQRMVTAYEFDRGELELLAQAAAAYDLAVISRNVGSTKDEIAARALAARLLCRLGIGGA